jgi:ribosomal protein L37E
MGKTEQKICLKCGSKDVEIVNLFGEEYIVCSHCGYDETEKAELEVSYEKSKKGRSVYRTGGGRRTRR